MSDSDRSLIISVFDAIDDALEAFDKAVTSHKRMIRLHRQALTSTKIRMAQLRGLRETILDSEAAILEGVLQHGTEETIVNKHNDRA